MKSILIESQFLGPVALFATLAQADEVTLERHENFVKQTYRNRCYINTTSGTEMLVIPVIHELGKTPITQVRIDYTHRWLNRHWRAIQSAYANAPWFEHYAPELEAVLFARKEFLYDLNRELLTMCLGWLRFQITVKESLTYVKTPEPSVNDMRSVINPKKSADLATFYSPVPYTQVFGSKFVPNLSILDLVFCQGPEANRIVKASVGEMNK